MAEKRPFAIQVPQTVLDDLQWRLAHTRWPDEIENSAWAYGTNLAYLKSLVDYWQHGFDWRRQEERLNRFAQFRAEIDGIGIHFIYERGQGPHPLPLVITHGWPGSFFEMYKIIPLLTDPASNGGDAADSFDVIVPSLPGFGFSDRPHVSGINSIRTAELWKRLASDILGYPRFAAAGGDIGAGVTLQLAKLYPDLLPGIHLTYLNFAPGSADLPDLTDAEKHYLSFVQRWSEQEGAYAHLHATKPQTLSYSLNNSPAGLAAWIVEKFRSWSDCDGDVERRFSKDELLTNIMIYWITETISSSIRMYNENSRPGVRIQSGERIRVPAGVALFPKELSLPPREWAERNLQIARWQMMPRGGHFAALEEPELLVNELRAFFRRGRKKFA